MNDRTGIGGSTTAPLAMRRADAPGLPTGAAAPADVGIVPSAHG